MTKSFELATNTGWSYPDGADPGDSRVAERILTDNAAGTHVISEETADAIVSAYNELQKGDKACAVVSYEGLFKPFHEEVSEEKLIVSKNGGVSIQSAMGNDPKGRGTVFITDCDGAAKALAKAYQDLPENAEGTIEMVHLFKKLGELSDADRADLAFENVETDHDYMKHQSNLAEERQELETGSLGVAFVHKGRVYGTDIRNCLAVTTDGSKREVTNGKCLSYQPNLSADNSPSMG